MYLTESEIIDLLGAGDCKYLEEHPVDNYMHPIFHCKKRKKILYDYNNIAHWHICKNCDKRR